MSFYYESLPIEKIYYGDDPINMVYYGSDLLFIRDVTLEIVPYPSDATVVLTATGYTQVDNSITVKYGTSVSYTVSKSGYNTSSGSMIVTNDRTLPVVLSDERVFTINPTPSNATVVLSADGYTQVGNSIVVSPGTVVSYSVSKTGYITQSDTVTVNSNQTIQVSLTLETHILTINPTPSDATVTFSTGTVTGNSCAVDYGTSVIYTISKFGYITSTPETVIVTSDQTINAPALIQDFYVPAINEVIVNLSGSSKYETNTKFAPGRYRVEVAPGGSDDGYNDGLTRVTNMNHVETINQPFIVRAYCGGNATSGSVGTNPYSGPFKVNGASAGTRANGIDVNHIFGAGGGNGNQYAAYLGDSFVSGGPNCLGNGETSTLWGTYLYGHAGSCCHLLPTNGVFGTNYLRAYHCSPVGSGLAQYPYTAPGGAYGGGAGGSRTDVGGGYSWSYRGGNSPYGNGGAAVTSLYVSAGTGIGAGGKTVYGTIHGVTADWVIGAGAYYNGSQWIDEPGNLTNTGSSYIRITYLGQ